MIFRTQVLLVRRCQDLSNVNKLPVSIRIVLGPVLRNCDGKKGPGARQSTGELASQRRSHR